jgi:hypothetical protein
MLIIRITRGAKQVKIRAEHLEIFTSHIYVQVRADNRYRILINYLLLISKCKHLTAK